jgi:5-methylcytosine-specific restriction protein A
MTAPASGAEYHEWYKTARWQKTRARQLQSEPLCRMCLAENAVVAATVCDHDPPHKGDPVKFWNGPFQSLCKSHHDRTKRQIETRGFSSDSDEDGNPTDPNHPWNR